MGGKEEPLVILGSDFIKKVVPLIERARFAIDIIVFDWRLQLDDPSNPVTKIVEALRGAQYRGVSVRVLVSNHAVADKLAQCGFAVRYLYSRKLMHAKMMLLDGDYAVIGSHNYTMSGLSQNLEVSIGVQLPNVINECSAFFTHLWGV